MPADTHIFLASFGIALVSGVFPLVNGELYLIGATYAVADLPTALVIAVIVAVGQTITHSTLFLLARDIVGISARHRKRFEERIAKARAAIERWKGRVLVLLASAATIGLPPMLAVSVTAGSLGIRFRTFVTFGLIGRILRFVTIAIIASLV